ncbi:hypothetical protein MBLNU230_g1239t1 [Neophaeotheca triangularis]
MKPSNQRKKVAIVGSGCAGLGAAWALKDSEYDVHIFERSSKLGGHTNTQTWRHQGKETPVDTGFIVMNTATYPNFLRFLKDVGVDTIETEMTFGVSRDGGAFEWSGSGKGIFAQRRNLFRPRHWRMIFDIIRFNQFALDLLSADSDDGRLGSSTQWRKDVRDLTIGEYLEREGYSSSFRDDYLIPMTAAVWSTSPDKASLDFPAQTLVRFMWNHHLLSTIAVRPPWLTIPGGSQRYIDAIIKSFPQDRLHIHTNSEVGNIIRPAEGSEDPVSVTWKNATSNRTETEEFVHAILACHGDEILPLLVSHEKGHYDRTSTHNPSATTSISREETEIFTAFRTTPNTAYMHSDLSLMPKRRAVWTAWNYLTTTPNQMSPTPKSPHSSPPQTGVSLTYNMNTLQHLPTSSYSDVLVTLNPPHPPSPSLTQGTYTYRHPLYTVAAVRAQNRLPSIQGKRAVSYAGAWTSYGFHEDGFSSGLRVAIDQLAAKVPWEFVDARESRGHRPELGWADWLLRLFLLVLVAVLRLWEWVVQRPGVEPVVAFAEAVGGLVLDVGEAALEGTWVEGKVKSG